MPSANPTSITSLFKQESESRSNTNPNPYKETRSRIAEILSVAPEKSKGLHVSLYRNLSRLAGKEDAAFVFLEWKLGDDRLTANDEDFYSQDKVTREAAAVAEILEEAKRANIRAIVVGLRDEPPGGPVERRIAALAVRKHLYPDDKITSLTQALGLSSNQVTIWPPATKKSALPPSSSATDVAPKGEASFGWRPSFTLHANLVLEGVPGTGKTHWVKSHARRLFSSDGADVGALGDGEFAITLHPATSYEDFVEGLRPGYARPALQSGVVRVDNEDVDLNTSTDNHRWFFCPVRTDLPSHEEHALDPESSTVGAGRSPTSFQVHDGFFLRACAHAVAHPEKGYVVLLDEFNRCNVPKVLGDLLTTLEPSKRATWTPSEGWSTKNSQVVTLPYSGRRFFVPANIVVVGTMNTTDRSVTGLDGALRRRFAFERVWPIGFRNDARVFAIEELLGAFEKTSPGSEVLQQVPLLVADSDAPSGPFAAANQDPGADALSSSDQLLQRTFEAWGRLNEQLLTEFGPDGVLGHSYLFDMARALRRDGRYWSADNPADTLRESWNAYLLPQLVEIFENGNAISSVSMEMPILKRLQNDLESLGTLRLEKTGKNTLLRRISLLLWPGHP